MQASTTLANLAQALAKAQAAIGPAVFDSTNPHFRSQYASLSAVTETIKLPLAKNGLAYVQNIVTLEGKPWLVTTLLHESGEWMTGAFELLVDKNTMQGMGSAITYGRRYALSALVGVVSDEDDDGHLASKHPKPKTPTLQAPPVVAEPKNALARIKQLMTEKHVAPSELKSYVMAAYGVGTSQELTETQKVAVVAMLENQTPDEIRHTIAEACSSIDEFLNGPEV